MKKVKRMNSSQYYVLNLEFRSITGPFSFRDAVKRQGANTDLGMQSIILREVVGVDGRRTK